MNRRTFLNIWNTRPWKNIKKSFKLFHTNMASDRIIWWHFSHKCAGPNRLSNFSTVFRIFHTNDIISNFSRFFRFRLSIFRIFQDFFVFTQDDFSYTECGTLTNHLKIFRNQLIFIPTERPFFPHNIRPVRRERRYRVIHPNLTLDISSEKLK